MWGLGNEDSGSENGVLALLFWPFLGSCRSSEAFAPSPLAVDSSDPSSALPAAIEGRPAFKCHVSEPPVYDSQPGIQVCFRRMREHNVCTIQEWERERGREIQREEDIADHLNELSWRMSRCPGWSERIVGRRWHYVLFCPGPRASEPLSLFPCPVSPHKTTPAFVAGGWSS